MNYSNVINNSPILSISILNSTLLPSSNSRLYNALFTLQIHSINGPSIIQRSLNDFITFQTKLQSEINLLQSHQTYSRHQNYLIRSSSSSIVPQLIFSNNTVSSAIFLAEVTPAVTLFLNKIQNQPILRQSDSLTEFLSNTTRLYGIAHQTQSLPTAFPKNGCGASHFPYSQSTQNLASLYQPIQSSVPINAKPAPNITLLPAHCASRQTSTSSVSSTKSAKADVRLADFHLLQVIGKGSFGKVMLVRKIDNNCVYAMKVLNKEHVIKRNQVDHTKTERSVLEYLRHPFIVTLRYAFQTSKKLFFVLDLCIGKF